MVCSPEQARKNGARSKGPTSERGKAIAARNATKHGLMAKQTPLLLTEDVTVFESIHQGLIDQYQPANQVENFLVQQLSMAMLRQYRLWAAEAAAANLKLLEAQKAAQFPDVVIPGCLSGFNAADSDLHDQRIPLSQIWQKEQKILTRLVEYLRQDLECLPAWDDTTDVWEWLDSVRETSGVSFMYNHRDAEVYKAQDEFDSWLDPFTYQRDHKTKPPELESVVQRIQHLSALATARLEFVEGQLSRLGQLEADIEQAQQVTTGVQLSEHYANYQRRINRDLEQALNRLEAVKQRRTEDSIGLFDQNA